MMFNSLVIALAVAASPNAGDRGDRTMIEVYEGSRDLLGNPGVHSKGGFVFSVIRFSNAEDSRDDRELDEAQGALFATRGFLLEKVSQALPLSDRSTAVRNVAHKIALTCAQDAVAVDSIQTVFSGVIGDSTVVVQGMPIAAVDRIKVAVDDLVPCIAARADKGAISVPEAMVLLELCPDASPLLPKVRGIAVAAFSSAYGSGIDLTVRGAWTNEGKTVSADALELWSLSASKAVARGETLSEAFAPIDLALLASLDLEERFTFLGHRMHDPNAIAALVKSLTDDGWLRAAEVMSAKPLSLAIVRDHQGFKLSPDLRAKIASTPIVTLLMLTAGQANVALTTGAESQLLVDARVAFDRKELADLLRAATLLQQSVASDPQIEAMVLLGATLLALDDPALALPICTAAFRAVPAHRYAGINLLRALRALELKDEARAILPNVRRDSGSHMSKWGNEQLALIETWIDPKPLPVPAAP